MRISDWSSDVCSSDLVSGDSFAPELLFLFISSSIGKYDRQRHLAVAEIVACILAHGLFIRRIVDGVVHELKGDTKVATIGVARHFLSIVAFSNDRCNTAGRCEESSRLSANDIQIMLFVRFIAALGSGRSDKRRGGEEGYG